jgi:hypothetical protein
MRAQLDLRPSPVVLALGALGLGSTGVAGAVAATPVAASAQGGALWLDGLPGGAGPSAPLAPLLAPISGRGTRVWISAATPRRNLLVGGAVSVSGLLRPAARADVVFVQERRGPGWATVARGVTGPAGRYRLAFRPAAPGSLTLRVGFAGDRVSPPAQARLGVVYVYRLAGASWYGPGGPLACGGTLTDDTLGVAHRTLPCGTLVRLRVGSRTVQVPVIDRGPYVAGRDYDLTPATKRALGFGDVGDVWVTR